MSCQRFFISVSLDLAFTQPDCGSVFSEAGAGVAAALACCSLFCLDRAPNNPWEWAEGANDVRPATAARPSVNDRNCGVHFLMLIVGISHSMVCALDFLKIRSRMAEI